MSAINHNIVRAATTSTSQKKISRNMLAGDNLTVVGLCGRIAQSAPHYKILIVSPIKPPKRAY
jgi:hypothetical protein